MGSLWLLLEYVGSLKFLIGKKCLILGCKEKVKVRLL